MGSPAYRERPVRERSSTGDSSECCHQQGRNLVVCIDSTSNQFGTKNTNVIELYNLISKGYDDQQSWYNSGIGTYSRSKLFRYIPDLRHWTDMAFAWSFKRTILGAYEWLSNNYKDGDCIFLFGFSRGAYQVRVLSAMIDKVGLIHKGNEMQIPFAFELYANNYPDKNPETGRRSITAADRFKKIFSRDVRVHFVGAWDTVSSIGIMRAPEMHPGTVNGMKHVCYFRHALALDEQRVKFLPEYAYGGRAEQEHTPHTLEVWFAGTHLDIGGRMALSGEKYCEPPLKWMVLEATILGLRLAQVDFLEDRSYSVSISLTRLWRMLEILPLKRLTFAREDAKPETTRSPHRGSGRKIHRGQRIHYSVTGFLERDEGYTPKATLPGLHWNDLMERLAEWVQHDMYSIIKSLSENLRAGNGDDLRKTFDGLKDLLHKPQAVCEMIISILDEDDDDHAIERNHQVMKSLMEFQEDEGTHISTRIPKFLSQFLDNEEYRKTALAFMEKYTNNCIHEFTGHKKSVQSAAFSADRTLVVSGSDDCTIRVWNLRTGRPGTWIRGHSHGVSAVAFSPRNDHVVSGSSVGGIRLWDAKTGGPWGSPFDRRHAYRVNSIAFSHDGDRIVSGSDDRTVRVWNVEKQEPVFIMKQHSGVVRFVAFYKNDVVSASDDNTIRIWDSSTGKQTIEPMRGHRDWVRSFAFSPDGELLASGSNDTTIRVWDMTTGQQLGEPFSGHSLSVTSVAFSRDGKRVVSGSKGDRTIRTWDVGTKKQLEESSKGHSDSSIFITSVTLSSDGERAVLGWSDGTVRIYLVPV